MNAKITLIVCLLISFSTFSQNYVDEIKEYQTKVNKEFADSSHSPLSKEDISTFKGLDFYPINRDYKVNAKFIKDKGKKV